MNFREFRFAIKKLLEDFLNSIVEKLNNKTIKIKSKYSFPNYLRIGESPHHWMIELSGVSELKNLEKFKLEAPRRSEKFQNTSAFFNPGVEIDNSMKSLIKLGRPGHSLIRLTLSTNYDYSNFQKFINLNISPSELKRGDAQIPIIIYPEAPFAFFYNVDLIRTESFKLYFKSIPSAMCIKKDISKEEFIKIVNENVNKFYNPPNINLLGRIVFGLNLDYEYLSEKFARDLLSLTNQTINERVIDRFIQKHLNHFTKSLRYEKGLSQVDLKILEGDFGNKKSLKPDYLMLRSDGFYDIIDIKTSALKKNSITIGDTSRIRFNFYVSELISQLVNYERYFKSEKNRNWALENYNIKISNPKLIGIVGNYQNFDRYNVDLALEQYKDNIILLSYFDLVNLLRKNQIK